MEDKKVIKITSKNSIIEGNLAEMPLINYSKGKMGSNIINYPWIDSKGQVGNIEIRGSSKHGLPKEFDFDVLLALLRLYAKQKEIAYNCLIEDDKSISSEDATVYLSLNELAKEMKKSTGGKNLKRLQDAIETLKDTTIHGQFYDKYKGKYVARVKKGVSIIDDYQFYEIQDDENAPGWRVIKEQTYVTFNKFYIRSIHNTYFKYYNYDQYLDIGKSGITKKLYLLLCKWRNNKPMIKIKLDTIYRKIPLDLEKEEKYNKKLIKSACEKLVSKEIIHSYTFDKDNACFYFVSPEKESKRLSKLMDKYNTFEQIHQWFLAHNFTQEELFSYMNTIMNRGEYVKALLRYIDDKEKEIPIKDIKQYMEKGMRVPYYEIDEKYYNFPPQKK